MSQRHAQRSALLFVLAVGLLMGFGAEARFPHGGWVSRDLQLVENEKVGSETLKEPTTLWVVSMEDGDGQGAMTAWSFCTAKDPDDCEDVCTERTDRADCPVGDPYCQKCVVPANLGGAVQACTPPCKTRHTTTSEDQQLYSSPGVSPDGRWVVYGTKDQVLHSLYWTETGWVASSWSALDFAKLDCDPVVGPKNGKFCKKINGVFRAKPNNLQKKWFANGFHARPLHLKLESEEIFVSANIGNNNEGYLHTYAIDVDGKLAPWQGGEPLLIDNEQQQYLLDLVEHRIKECETCADGDTTCESDCSAQKTVTRVYLAVEDSDKKADFPVRAVGFSSFDCAAATVPCFADFGSGGVGKGPSALGALGQRVPGYIKAGARLGGLVMEDVTITDDQGATTTSDLFIYNLHDGVIAMSLEPENWGEMIWHRYLRQVHRTKPTLSQTARDENQVSSNNPVLYLGQREKGVCKGGQARIYRLDPGTGLPANAAEDTAPEPEGDVCDTADEIDNLIKPDDYQCVAKGFMPGENQPRPMFPRCYDEKIGNASFSSPMVSPVSGHVFFGPAHQGDPIYKVDPRNPQRSWTLGEDKKPAPDNDLHNYTRLGWLDYAPKDGWRTNATFSEDGYTMYIGSAGGIVYAMDADEPCGVVRWCFDTRKDGDVDRSAAGLPSTYTLNGGYCDPYDVGGEIDYEDIPCCAALLDPSSSSVAPTYRRMAKQCASCWDTENNPTHCKVARVGKGSSFLWNGADEDPGNAKHYDVTREEVAVDFCTEAQWGYSPQDLSWYVTFDLELKGTEGATLSDASIARGEAMNEATGEIFDTVPRAGTNGHEVAVYVEAISDPGSPGGFDRTNPIRFALFDSYGNESMVRVRLDGIPPAGSSCPLP